MSQAIRSVFIGNFSKTNKKENRIYGLKNYTQFYNELVENAEPKNISVFAGYVLPNDPGFEFSFDQQLSDKINFTLCRGNSPTTKLLPFIWNNLVAFFRLTLFCLKKGNYFVFLPSPIGVWSILVLTMFGRKEKLGIYIGGHYGREQSFEQRKGVIKKKIKKLSAILVDRLVIYAIKKSDYVITSSYEYYHHYSATKKIFLTPPMLNVDESDLELTYSKGNQNFITYCGELRHAKGVIELIKAFAQLINENSISNCKLKIIGSGQAFGELNDLAKINGIEDLVVFCGQIKDREKLKEELANSTIFVLPSYSEGFPRVAYECFTLGIPTILTPVGGIPFFVRDNEQCLFTQPGNINDLATKMSILLGDENLRIRLSENAKQLMTKNIFPRIKTDGSLAKMIKNHVENHLIDQ